MDEGGDSRQSQANDYGGDNNSEGRGNTKQGTRVDKVGEGRETPNQATRVGRKVARDKAVGRKGLGWGLGWRGKRQSQSRGTRDNAVLSEGRGVDRFVALTALFKGLGGDEGRRRRGKRKSYNTQYHISHVSQKTRIHVQVSLL
ncbi:hypothetical protein EYF80_027998 [Liparis tanakae]|uniref:Uncharacterized protein n=1 Tax=Liparis tanakae TaxID=230148 RepID=A0A4Z2H7M9_9TELE|nr:hypothetical protein EYF80_027998 [Liparis tanakae]